MLYVITSNLGHVGQVRFRFWSRMECITPYRIKASLYAMRYQIISHLGPVGQCRSNLIVMHGMHTPR